jgi:hypothetical protein
MRFQTRWSPRERASLSCAEEEEEEEEVGMVVVVFFLDVRGGGS